MEWESRPVVLSFIIIIIGNCRSIVFLIKEGIGASKSAPAQASKTKPNTLPPPASSLVAQMQRPPPTRIDSSSSDDEEAGFALLAAKKNHRVAAVPTKTEPEMAAAIPIHKSFGALLMQHRNETGFQT